MIDEALVSLLVVGVIGLAGFLWEFVRWRNNTIRMMVTEPYLGDRPPETSAQTTMREWLDQRGV